MHFTTFEILFSFAQEFYEANTSQLNDLIGFIVAFAALKVAAIYHTLMS